MVSDSNLYQTQAPSREEVLTEIKRIIGEQMGMDPAGIRDTDHLVNDIGCDSLDLVEITMEVEEHFGISVPDDVAEGLRVVGLMADGVLELLAQSKAEHGAA